MIRLLSKEEQRAIHERERIKFASDYCGGDVVAADAILDSLPYSSIPDWRDAREAVEAIRANLKDHS